ncbi:putative bacilliredoxin, YphP/YqiW family [Paenibacillus tianmuensis]|uniref:Putative bacilliredoxin, YphP/YqiW family n=1 Tax=Paenibacillus tianmuensis TaxID=624147 RepID=A0A1G4RWC4_9BACL|nr:BrxA/BrxB family bacilliredoxin [Paenibacillus tianmuensis]SCW61263.1 putative bacilliredoxin, YphP/YqiW family [Paenibacillus tianmuensis]
MSMSFEAYMRDMVQPMREELTRIGVTELRTPEEVSEALDNMKGTALIVVNSVCGCAAGQCRPGVAKALQHEVKPDHLYTVFAGQDKEATAKAREYFAPYPPSSPSIALMKDGQLVHFIPRHQVEDRSAEMIGNDLIGAFETHCK